MPAGNTTTDGTIVSDYLTKWDGANWNATIHLYGTFDGATVTVYRKSDGDPTLGPANDGWIPFKGGTYTAEDEDVINVGHKASLRIIVSGSGGSTDIDWNLV